MGFWVIEEYRSHSKFHMPRRVWPKAPQSGHGRPHTRNSAQKSVRTRHPLGPRVSVHRTRRSHSKQCPDKCPKGQAATQSAWAGPPTGRQASRGAPEVRALSAALGVATRNLALVGVVVPQKNRLEHLTQTLPARTLRGESCKRWLHKKLKPPSCSLLEWGFSAARS